MATGPSSCTHLPARPGGFPGHLHVRPYWTCNLTHNLSNLRDAEEGQEQDRQRVVGEVNLVKTYLDTPGIQQPWSELTAPPADEPAAPGPVRTGSALPGFADSPHPEAQGAWWGPEPAL